ncbi:extradiol dioxygenase [Pedobacter sp. Leaf41]|jgi:predicted lactoylglutathione lyase|uniref:VOC family protein n=1 Tax=Pedobacter sp. Leaf41 TaxID=1736218 RepID=UPI0007033524|nr:VOC family protein [Pedobacter sp. Leaf41]KQN38764.1 extradiol dioxygenase [Pedobacter sp. Leaf41]RZK67671.1 MAG: extradiol dioxygenase [Pedobacter sp.]
MIKSLWINLPVKDVKKSKEFFTKLGFKLNLQYGVREDSASFLVGDAGLVLMLFEKSLYEGFAGSAVPESFSGNEVLFSFDAESPEEVDNLAKKVVEAGGSIYGEPGYKDDWMYGCGFIDLDGQRWSILFMDFSKMPLG